MSMTRADHIARHGRSGGAAALAVFIAAMIPATAGAQVLEEIVVTAERRETLLQDTPISIVAFTPENLEAQVVSDFYDLQTVTPNLNVTPGRGSGAHSAGFNIRGVGGGGGPGLDTDGGVALYIDDVYFPSARRSALRAVDIESIEVLRGPQGTLFGRNSTGGAIRITTRKPSEEYYADVTIRAGDYGRADLEASVNFPLSDNFFVKGDLASLNRDGYIRRKDVPGDQGLVGDVDDTIASIAFRWVPDDTVTVDFKIRSEDANGNLATRDLEELNILTVPGLGAHIRELNRQLVNNGEPALVQNDPRLVLDDFTISGYCFLFDNDPLSWESDCDTWEISDNQQYTGTLNWDLAENQSLRVTIGQHQVFNSASTDWIAYGAEVRQQEYDADATMVEVLLNSVLADGALDLVSGINHYSTDRGTMQHVLRNQNPDQDADTRDIWGDSFSGSALGIFAQGTYHLPDDRTNVTLGLRYTDEDATFTMREWESGDFNITGWNDCSTASSTSGVVVRDPNCLWMADGSDNWTETDYRFALDYELSDQAMIYGSISKAYRAGAFNHDGAMGLPTIDPAGYTAVATDPEKLVSTEIGLRSDWLNDRLRFNLTYFDMDFSNRQGAMLITTGDSAVVEVVDLGDVDSKGWEMDFGLAVTDNLTLSLGAGATDAILLEPSPPLSVHLANIAPLSYNASLRHEAEVGAGTLMTNLNYAWQDEFYNHSSSMTDQAYTTPAVGLLNGRIAWFHAEQALTVAFEGINLTNEVYGRHHSKFARFFHGGAPGNRPNTENYAIFADRGPPRMIAFTLTKEFGNR